MSSRNARAEYPRKLNSDTYSSRYVRREVPLCRCADAVSHSLLCPDRRERAVSYRR